VLLARLALDRSLQGQGLGGELLVDALSRAVQASEVAAARLVVVDAIDEAAAAFYEHHGFVAVPGNRQRLVQKSTTSLRRSADSRARALELTFPSRIHPRARVPPTTGMVTRLDPGSTVRRVPPSGSRVYSWSLEKTTRPMRWPAGKT
jgi:Acetyltransferase (GNAT) domain